MSRYDYEQGCPRVAGTLEGHVHGGEFVTPAKLQELYPAPGRVVVSSPARVARPATVTSRLFFWARPGSRRASGSQWCHPLIMEMSKFERLAASLDGVSTRTREGWLTCRYHGRLVARQIDETHVVIRCSLELRHPLLDQFPGTFSVPQRFAKHMMIVADLHAGDEGAIEDALVAAWRLQSDAAPGY
jgi:hypothetical protein